MLPCPLASAGPAGAVTSGLSKSGGTRARGQRPPLCPARFATRVSASSRRLDGQGPGLEPRTPTGPCKRPHGSRKRRRLPPRSVLPQPARPRLGSCREGLGMRGHRSPGPGICHIFPRVNYHRRESQLRPSGHNKPLCCCRVGNLSLSQVTAAGPGQNCPYSGGTTSPEDPSCPVMGGASLVGDGDWTVRV